MAAAVTYAGKLGPVKVTAAVAASHVPDRFNQYNGSISVLHERAALADAWATALSVLGPDEGLAVAEREGLAAFFIVRTQDGFESRATSTFRERHGPEPQSR